MSAFSELQELAEQFIELSGFNMGCKASYGKCYLRSELFAAWLKTLGFTPLKLELYHSLVPMPVDCDDRWKVAWPHVGHYMTIHDGFVVDLSGAQFGKMFSKLLWNYSELKQLWRSVSIMNWSDNDLKLVLERWRTDGRKQAKGAAWDRLQDRYGLREVRP